VSDARALAWDEYTRNTLANHATLWPDHWDGTISVDDVCFGFYSAHPDYCGNGLGTTYEGQITEQPTWMVMNAIRLAGVTPVQDGYRVVPHLPSPRSRCACPKWGWPPAPECCAATCAPSRAASCACTWPRPPVSAPVA
jgi:hypothetical protein